MGKTIFKDYISTEGEERIKTYKYNCQCDSVIYNYIMSPLANLNVQILPKNLAPNTITMIAFVFNIIPHLLIIAYTGESLSTDVPRWLMVMTAICQFLYMHFDNMDGKQARRTNSSSSLGMLYDHGLDSLSGWIVSLNLASIIKLGNGLFAYYVLALVPLLGFYFTMWEEYHLNILNFGVINPVDEGLTVLNLIILFTGIVGPDFWVKEAFFGLQRNQLVGIVTGLGCLGAMVVNTMNVVKRSDVKKRQSFDKLKISLFLVLGMTIIAMYSPTDIVMRRTRSLITCFGFGFCKVIGHIQLAHCAGDEFDQWRRSFIATTTVLVANTLVAAFFGKGIISEDLLLNITIALNIWFYLHYVLSMTKQLTRVLGIKVFSVTKPKEK